jgi:hypothetical protein
MKTMGLQPISSTKNDHRKKKMRLASDLMGERYSVPKSSRVYTPFRHLWRRFCQAGMPVQEYGAEVCAPIPVAVGVGRSAPSQPSLGWSVRLLPHIP